MLQHHSSNQEGKDKLSINQRATPRELVKRMIKDPHYHVTEEDIKNIDISVKVSENIKLHLSKGQQDNAIKYLI